MTTYGDLIIDTDTDINNNNNNNNDNDTKILEYSSTESKKNETCDRLYSKHSKISPSSLSIEEQNRFLIHEEQALKNMSGWPIIADKGLLDAIKLSPMYEAVPVLNAHDKKFQLALECDSGVERMMAHRGYLEKQGELIKNWKIRYFCLYLIPPSFEYYEDQSVANRQLKLYGTFSWMQRTSPPTTFQTENPINSKRDLAINTAYLDENTTVKNDDSDAFAFKIITKHRTWRLKANSKQSLQSWMHCVRAAIQGWSVRILQERNILHKIIRSLDFCNGWFQQPFEGVPFVSTNDTFFVKSKLTALNKFWMTLLTKYSSFSEIKRVLENETTELNVLVSRAKELSERVERRARIHESVKTFQLAEQTISQKLELGAGFIDLNDYEETRALWKHTQNELDKSLHRYSLEDEVLKSDIVFIAKHILPNIVAEINALFSAHAKQLNT